MDKKHGPWTITDSKIVYENPWIKVREDKVIHPDGKPGIFGIVDLIGGISVIPIDDDDYAYMNEEFHYAIVKKDIEATSGAKDPGETPLEAAKRELKEELGIEAEEWIDLGRSDPLTTIIKSPQHLFLARKLTFGEHDREASEVLEMKKFKFEELFKMVMNSEITHSSTALLIMKINEFLKKEKK